MYHHIGLRLLQSSSSDDALLQQAQYARHFLQQHARYVTENVGYLDTGDPDLISQTHQNIASYIQEVDQIKQELLATSDFTILRNNTQIN